MLFGWRGGSGFGRLGVVKSGLAATLAALEALLWHSGGTDDHLVDGDGDILT